MRLAGLCTTDVVTATPTERIVDVAVRMREEHVGDVVIKRTRDGSPFPACGKLHRRSGISRTGDIQRGRRPDGSAVRPDKCHR